MALSPELPEPAPSRKRRSSGASISILNDVSSDSEGDDGLGGRQRTPSSYTKITPSRSSIQKPASIAKPPKSRTQKTVSKAEQRASSVVSTKYALKEARAESSQRLRLAWDDIFDRYTRNDHLASGRDDIYDFETGELVHDGGFLDDTIELLDTAHGERPVFAANAEIPIGHFGLPGAMGQDDKSDSESEEEQASDLDCEAPRRQTLEAVSDADSSEDELGIWLGGQLQPVSATFKRVQREKVDLSEDLRNFMSINDRSSQMLQLQALDNSSTLSDSPATLRRAKQESVKPSLHGVSILKAATPSPIGSPASTPYTWPKLGYFKPSSRSSPMPCAPTSRSSSVMSMTKPVSSFSLASSKPSSSASSQNSGVGFGITAKVKLAGGNAILTQAYSNDADSSDDDFGIRQSASKRRPNSARAYSTNASSGRASSTFASGQAEESPTPRAASMFCQTQVPRPDWPSNSATKRRQPVVEVVVRSRSLSMSPRKTIVRDSSEIAPFPFTGSTAPQSASASKHVPRRPSPLKQSSVRTYQPLSPPASYSSTSSVTLYDQNVPSPRTSPDCDQSDVFRAPARPSKPVLESVSAHLDTSRSSEVFGRSESQKPDPGLARPPMRHGIYFSAAGLPTPPPSSASSTGKSMSPERMVERYSTVSASFDALLSDSIAHTSAMSESPAKRKRDDTQPQQSPRYIMIDSDDDSTDDELLLETPNRSRRMTSVSLPFSLSSPAKPSPGHTPFRNSPAPHPERLRCSSLIRSRSRSASLSPVKRRLPGSPSVQASPARSRTMAPIAEDDGEESDDPLGI